MYKFDYTLDGNSLLAFMDLICKWELQNSLVAKAAAFIFQILTGETCCLLILSLWIAEFAASLGYVINGIGDDKVLNVVQAYFASSLRSLDVICAHFDI